MIAFLFSVLFFIYNTTVIIPFAVIFHEVRRTSYSRKEIEKVCVLCGDRGTARMFFP